MITARFWLVLSIAARRMPTEEIDAARAVRWPMRPRPLRRFGRAHG